MTVEGPDGPVTDTRGDDRRPAGHAGAGRLLLHFQQREQRPHLGLPGRVPRRGWLYKGHDSMPWCARCGTGMSQMEMNEGYQDREDPGLTVRLPLVDRPGESLLVWTTTPWTMTANVAAAVGPELDLRQGRARATTSTGWARARSRRALQGDFKVLEEQHGRGPRRLALRGPFDDLPAVPRRSLRAAARTAAPGYGTASCRGPRSARKRARASCTSRPAAALRTYQLGKALGLPVIAPLDEAGRYLTASAAGRYGRARASREPSWRSWRRAASSTTWSRTRTATRTAGAAARRCSSASWTSGTSRWARSTTSRATRSRPSEKDASLRYQIMDVVDQIAGSRASATSASSTGCARWPTG